MERRGNRILIWALAISLAAHAVFIYWAQELKPSAAEPAEPPGIVRIWEHPHHPPTPPPPAPTPRPLVRSRARPAEAHRPSPPILAPARTGGPAEPRTPAAPPIEPPGPGDLGGPTGSPEPTAAPTAACSAPEIAARTVTTVTPDTPRIAQEQGATGTAQVRVELDASGAVTDVTIYRSSGSPVLDTAALGAAKESTYRPEIRNCEGVPGSYLFTVTFQ